MRLVDADHLIGLVNDATILGDGFKQAFTAIVKGEPTIEERKTGKWIERNPQNSDKCRLIECDQCGFAHIVGFNVPYEHWIENRNFCERCGADMRKKGEK